MPQVVTFGEAMVLFAPQADGRLQHVDHFTKHLAGAESNVAIGLARLGHEVAWAGRLGDDPFGRFALATLRGEGVDTRAVVLDPDHPTAVYFKERRGSLGGTHVYYYRRGSAAAHYGPDDLPRELIASARLLHLSGITPALSPACREAVFAAAELAREQGVTITCDPNVRLKLWAADEARRVVLDLLGLADIHLPSLEEGRLLFDSEEPEVIARRCVALGARLAVVTMGAEGAYWYNGEAGGRVPPFPVVEVDPVGAGDAFAAGLISGLLRGDEVREAVRRGSAMGAFAVTVPGDVEGLPGRDELDGFLADRGPVQR